MRPSGGQRCVQPGLERVQMRSRIGLICSEATEACHACLPYGVPVFSKWKVINQDDFHHRAVNLNTREHVRVPCQTSPCQGQFLPVLRSNMRD